MGQQYTLLSDDVLTDEDFFDCLYIGCPVVSSSTLTCVSRSGIKTSPTDVVWQTPTGQAVCTPLNEFLRSACVDRKKTLERRDNCMLCKEYLRCTSFEQYANNVTARARNLVGMKVDNTFFYFCLGFDDEDIRRDILQTSGLYTPRNGPTARTSH